jgi:hypothetical protein
VEIIEAFEQAVGAGELAEVGDSEPEPGVVAAGRSRGVEEEPPPHPAASRQATTKQPPRKRTMGDGNTYL